MNVWIQFCLEGVWFCIFFFFLSWPATLGQTYSYNQSSNNYPLIDQAEQQGASHCCPCFACRRSTLFTDHQFTKDPSTNLLLAQLNKQQAVGDREVVALELFDLLLKCVNAFNKKATCPVWTDKGHS